MLFVGYLFNLSVHMHELIVFSMSVFAINPSSFERRVYATFDTLNRQPVRYIK